MSDRELDRINAWLAARRKPTPSRGYWCELVIDMAWALVVAALGYVWMVGMLCL